jgi:FAD:protein FMN transferase
VESRPVAGHAADNAGRPRPASRREGPAPHDAERPRHGADAVDGNASDAGAAGRRDTRHLAGAAARGDAASGNHGHDGHDDAHCDHGPAADHGPAGEEGSTDHVTPGEGASHLPADHEGAYDDDDRVHAAATARATAVHGIQVPLTEARAAGYWSESRTRAMGTTAHLVLGDAPAGVAEWALAEIERLEQCWSRFRPDSELARLHARAGEWVDVSPAMLLALTCAADLHHTTAGRFDPTILDALERAGYDRSFELVELDADREGTAAACVAACGLDRVEIDVDAARVRAPAGVRIDLGGLGKGLAVDLVSRGLVDRGARTALVSLGGDMRARGEPPAGGWRVPVEHPLDHTVPAFVYPLAGGALVSSTRRIRAWARGDREYHHIIDPRTGDSTRTPIVAVVATAGDAWWAEGIAKAIMIAGVEDGAALARSTGVRAWMFLEEGQLVEAGP